MREATSARCFASAATTHRAASSSARSAPLPSLVFPVPSEALLRRAQGTGATRSAVAVEGVTFRSESEGMRWDRGDAVAGRVAVPPVTIWKNESKPRPSSEGRASGRDGSGTLRVSSLLRGTAEGGARARFPGPSPHQRPRRQPSRFARAQWIPNGGSMRPGMRHALRGDMVATPARVAMRGRKGPVGRARAFLPSGLARGVAQVVFQGRLVRSDLGAFGSEGIATWLILPVVICLSQRLSHACVSINSFVL